jgi:uridine monophosphate synthetase
MTAPQAASFFERLEAAAQARNSLLCVGLDPAGGTADELRAECFRLIDFTQEVACAYKPNSAFFEALGGAGLTILQEVIAHVPAGIPVILDAKRGDIASTGAAYARAAFDVLRADALTVNPYLGGEALEPFFARPERGLFVLCKTSNPGADEFQGLTVTSGGEAALLYEVAAQRILRWSPHNNVGLVVAATDPQALARIRALAPGAWFLVPGVGAQGGDLRAALAAGLRPDGLGLLINVSRGIASAADPAAEARRLRDEINAARQPVGRPAEAASPVSRLAQDLAASGCVRFGKFTLKSGVVSPIYLDLRQLVSCPPILRRVAGAYAGLLRGMAFDRLAGIPYAALPIATAISLEMNRPLIYPRREAKDYGTKAAVEGEFKAGETALVIDDLATTGGAKLEAIQKLEAAGLVVRDVVVLIDREQGARETLAAAGYHLHAVVTLRQLLGAWQASAVVTPEQYRAVLAFLQGESAAPAPQPEA